MWGDRGAKNMISYTVNMVSFPINNIKRGTKRIMNDEFS